MRTRRFVMVMEPGQRKIGALVTRGLWTSRLLPGRVERGVCYLSSWADVCRVLELSAQPGWSLSGGEVWDLARLGHSLIPDQCAAALEALTPHAWWVIEGDIDGAQIQGWIAPGEAVFLTALAGEWTCAIEHEGERTRMKGLVRDPYEAYLWGLEALARQRRVRRSA